MWNKETNRPDDWDDTRWNTMRVEGTVTFKGGMLSPDIAFEAGANAVIPEAKAEGRRELIEKLKKRATFMEWEWENSKGIWEIFFDDNEFQQLLKELGE